MADGTPSMASVLDALRGVDAFGYLRPEWPEPTSSYISPGYYLGGRIYQPESGPDEPAAPPPGRASASRGCSCHNEENPMSEPLDPTDAQNPDDTSGGSDDAAALQGDIATDSDDE